MVANNIFCSPNEGPFNKYLTLLDRVVYYFEKADLPNKKNIVISAERTVGKRIKILKHNQKNVFYSSGLIFKNLCYVSYLDKNIFSMALNYFLCIKSRVKIGMGSKIHVIKHIVR